MAESFHVRPKFATADCESVISSERRLDNRDYPLSSRPLCRVMRFVKRSVRVIGELSRIRVYPSRALNPRAVPLLASRGGQYPRGTPVSRHFADIVGVAFIISAIKFIAENMQWLEYVSSSRVTNVRSVHTDGGRAAADRQPRKDACVAFIAEFLLRAIKAPDFPYATANTTRF